jgi:hypothetical protein
LPFSVTVARPARNGCPTMERIRCFKSSIAHLRYVRANITTIAEIVQLEKELGFISDVR